MTKKEKIVDARFRREYHTTLKDYRRVLKHQGGVCAGCKKEKVFCKGKKFLAIDHDHDSGLLRGLLCYKCNKLLGLFNAFFKYDIQVLRNLFDYLDTHPFVSCFGENRYTIPGRVGTKKRRKALKDLKCGKSTMLKIRNQHQKNKRKK